MPAKTCLHFRVLRDLCGEKMGTEFMTIYLEGEVFLESVGP